MTIELAQEQKKFLEDNQLVKVTSDRHLVNDGYVAFVKYRDLITVVEEIFRDESFAIEQSVSIDKKGIPRLVEFHALIRDEENIIHSTLLAQFLTYHETTTVIFENDFIIVQRVDKVFYDKPIESDYRTVSKQITSLAGIPLYEHIQK